MTYQRRPIGSYFGPRPHMSTRLKLASGHVRKRQRIFRSKRMMQIDKGLDRNRVNLEYVKLQKSDYNSGGQQGNVASQARENPLKDSDNQSSNPLASNSRKSSALLVSGHPRQPSTSRVASSLNPSSPDFKCLEPSGVGSEARAVCDDSRKQRDPMDANESANFGSLLDSNQHVEDLKSKSRKNSSPLRGMDLSRGLRDKSSYVEDKGCSILPSKHETSLKLCDRAQSVGDDCAINDGMSKRRKELVPEEKLERQGDNRSEGLIKRRRTSEDEVDECGQNLVGVEDDIAELTQVATLKDSVQQPCNCCSKPIDEPTWSGTFKIDGNEYILAAHLSTKASEKVWALSECLLPSVEVTKVSKAESWPKKWVSSKPTGDSIGLFFFPDKMRHDKDLDQLIKEITENDLVLRAVIGEAEMLIFSSSLLPERYKTFRGKHYLWGVFKPREQTVIAAEPPNVTSHCALRGVKEEQQVSNQQDEAQHEEPGQEVTLKKCAKPLENQQLPASTTHQVQACSVQGPTNMGLELEAPEEGILLGDACATRSTAFAPDAATDCSEATTPVADAASIPTETASVPNVAATLPTNHGWINSSTGDTPGSKFLTIIVEQTPNVEQIVEQFTRDMQRSGAIVLQEGKMLAGRWPGNRAAAMQ
ncbi:hypothetical protein ACP4OV_003193 [Aristida adscensionis]